MITTRRNTFETNSSSTHSISIASKDMWDMFINGEAFFYRYSGDIVTLKDIRAIIEREDDFSNPFSSTIDAVPDEDIIEWINDNCYDYGPFYTYESLDFPCEEVFNQDGNPIVVYSYYFYD